jgi:hypothetical protein
MLFSKIKRTANRKEGEEARTDPAVVPSSAGVVDVEPARKGLVRRLSPMIARPPRSPPKDPSRTNRRRRDAASSLKAVSGERRSDAGASPAAVTPRGSPRLRTVVSSSGSRNSAPHSTRSSATANSKRSTRSVATTIESKGSTRSSTDTVRSKHSTSHPYTAGTTAVHDGSMHSGEELLVEWSTTIEEREDAPLVEQEDATREPVDDRCQRKENKTTVKDEEDFAREFPQEPVKRRRNHTKANKKDRYALRSEKRQDTEKSRRPRSHNRQNETRLLSPSMSSSSSSGYRVVVAQKYYYDDEADGALMRWGDAIVEKSFIFVPAFLGCTTLETVSDHGAEENDSEKQDWDPRQHSRRSTQRR